MLDPDNHWLFGRNRRLRIVVAISLFCCLILLNTSQFKRYDLRSMYALHQILFTTMIGACFIGSIWRRKAILYVFGYIFGVSLFLMVFDIYRYVHEMSGSSRFDIELDGFLLLVTVVCFFWERHRASRDKNHPSLPSPGASAN
ncbi:MAG TPA: hypothetical protein VEH50_13840 [Methylomirabilota bacterium]|nr:hypothetical protein [Methylomirabilota bacterium]